MPRALAAGTDQAFFGRLTVSDQRLHRADLPVADEDAGIAQNAFGSLGLGDEHEHAARQFPPEAFLSLRLQPRPASCALRSLH